MSAPSALRPSVGRLFQSSRIQQRIVAPSSTTTLLLTHRPAPFQPAGSGASSGPLISSSPFSTTAALQKRAKRSKKSPDEPPPPPKKRVTRDNNRLRGVSTLRRTGPRERLSVSGFKLPRPTTRSPGELAARQQQIGGGITDPDHGLWGFFYDTQGGKAPEKYVQTPVESSRYGRAWSVEECRGKSFEDLHRLWWVCVRERNRIATTAVERRKQEYGFGDNEARARDFDVRLTMRAIKHVLTERFYTWEDALKLAKRDREIDLSGEGPAFTPSAFLEPDSPADFLEKEDTEAQAIPQDAPPAAKPEEAPKAAPQPSI